MYAVHPDMRSHSGIIMTLGKGATYTASTKQKINTKSSMEAELVAIDDSMAPVLWTRHFWYPRENVYLLQQSARTIRV